MDWAERFQELVEVNLISQPSVSEGRLNILTMIFRLISSLFSISLFLLNVLPLPGFQQKFATLPGQKVSVE